MSKGDPMTFTFLISSLASGQRLFDIDIVQNYSGKFKKLGNWYGGTGGIILVFRLDLKSV